MAGDKLKIRVDSPGDGPVVAPSPHAPGTTFQPSHSDPETEETEVKDTDPRPPRQPKPITDIAPPVEPKEEPDELAPIELDDDTPVAAVTEHKSSHVVSHPHKHSMGKSLLRELLYLGLLLVVVAAGALAAIYFLKI